MGCTVFVSRRLVKAMPKLFSYCNNYLVTIFIIRDDLIYLLTAIGLTPGGSSTVHNYIQRVYFFLKKRLIYCSEMYKCLHEFFINP